MPIPYTSNTCTIFLTGFLGSFYCPLNNVITSVLPKASEFSNGTVTITVRISLRINVAPFLIVLLITTVRVCTPSCSDAGRWYQLRVSVCHHGTHEGQPVEYRQPDLWEWRGSTAEATQRHSEVCLQVQLCHHQWKGCKLNNWQEMCGLIDSTC